MLKPSELSGSSYIFDFSTGNKVLHTLLPKADRILKEPFRLGRPAEVCNLAGLREPSGKASQSRKSKV